MATSYKPLTANITSKAGLSFDTGDAALGFCGGGLQAPHLPVYKVSTHSPLPAPP